MQIAMHKKVLPSHLQVVHMLLAGVIFITALLSPAAQANVHAATMTIVTPQQGQGYVNSDLRFEPNVGQAAAGVQFQARATAGALSFAANEVLLRLPAHQGDGDVASQPIDLHLHFLSANTATIISALSPMPGVANYLMGADPGQWHTNVPTFGGIRYRQLYPGIDLDYRGDGGALKGTFVVAPGADAAQIHWQYADAAGVQVDAASGDLHVIVVKGEAGKAPVEVRESAPVAWQIVNAARVPVNARYAVAADGTIGFALGAYDPALPLIIDPTIVFSTFLGGSLEEAATSVALDSQNNVYLTGYTLSTDLPVVNAFDDNAHSGRDLFVARLNAAGTAFDYVTYIGGDNEDIAYGIATDSSGNAYVAGSTKSPDFPVLNAYQSTLQSPSGEAFVTKLSAAGSLLYSTYLGGEGSAGAQGIAVDVDGYAYVVGLAGAGFPQLNPFGTGDAFITKLDVSGSHLVYSTMIGVTNGAGATAVAVDFEGSAYVGGTTNTDDFLTKNPYQLHCVPAVAGPCSIDAWVAKVNRFGSGVDYATFLGGSGVEYLHALAVDADGNAIVSGYTASNNFPTTAGSFQHDYGGGSSDGFVTKLNAQGNGLLYSTYLGGSAGEDYYPLGNRSALALDTEGNAVVAGSTGSPDFPTLAAIKPNNRTGDTDGYVVKLNAAGGAIYSTYLGSSTDADGAYAVAVNPLGDAYVAGGSRSPDFPLQNPIQGNNAGGFSDIFLTRIAHGPPPPVLFAPTPLSFPTLHVHAMSGLQMIIVRNSGSADLSISNVSIVGAQAQDFLVQAAPCTQSPVRPGATCAVGVTFSPRASGMRFARVVFSSPSWSGVRGVPVRGKGAPTTSFDPPQITFAATPPNSAGAPTVETLTNIGYEPLQLGAVTITGLHSEEFQIVEDHCSQQAVPADGACTVSVRFAPKQNGDRFGALTFASQSFDEPVQVPLQGTGALAPSLVVEGFDYGICTGSKLVVTGSNFPKPGPGLQGAYKVYFDGKEVASGTTDQGEFRAEILVPYAADVKDSHVISATDLQVANAKAKYAFNTRTLDNDLPVILIPGASGSLLDPASPFIYTAPPDPNLAVPIPDFRQLLPQPFAYTPLGHVWIDGGSVLSIISGNYRMMDALQLKPDGQTPLPDFLGASPDLKVGDVLWNVDLGVTKSDFYEVLRDFLLAQKNGDGTQRYRPGETLFYFPYDWRKDLTPTADALDALINQALATSGKNKVVIVAHSLGGLVSRNYLLRKGGAKVDQLITLGTPYLGSVLVPQVLENGNDWGIGGHATNSDFGWGMHPKEMKKIAQNFGSAYEMLPALGYFDQESFTPAYNPHYLIRQSLIDGTYRTEPLDYAQSVAFMGERHNAALNTIAENFRQGLGDLRLLTDQVFHQRIMGTGIPVIDRLNFAPRRVCATVPFFNVLACINMTEYSYVSMDITGDDTVPLHSAMGAHWPNDHRFYILPGAHHGALTSDPRSLALIGDMLKGQRCSNQFPPLSSELASVASEEMQAAIADPEPLVTGAEVAVMGAANLDVYDAQGKHTGIVPATLYQTEIAIPGSNYVWVDGGRTATLMTDGAYTVVVHGIQPDGAAMIRINTLTAGIATKSVIFENIAVTGTGVATFTLNLPGPTVSQQLDYQYSAESPVQQVNQLPELTGEAATDLLPPHTTLTVDAQGMVTLAALDSGGAGVRYIQYSTENPPLHFSPYSGPFQLEPHGHVTAFATDWAGNSEYPPVRVGQFSLLYIPVINRN